MTLPASPPPPLRSSHIRAEGMLRAGFASQGGQTHLTHLHEAGGLRLRLPSHSGGCEGVLINTGGGIAGGDSGKFDFTAGENASIVLTTQAAEKVYRTESEPARINVALTLDNGARLEWLPQETILFNQAALQRRLNVNMVASASLCVLESVIFGRLAMGEVSTHGHLRDSWRVRRGGELVFAEEMVLDGPIGAVLNRPVCGAGARAIATLLHVAPDAEGRLDDLRDALEDMPCEHGLSAWNGMLVARLATPSPERLRAAIVVLLARLRGRNVPRVWQF